MASKPQKERILRTDGKPIFLAPKRGHLLICARGCCCGHTERGIAAVPIDFYKEEYKRRRIRDRVQLTMSGCLGPCPLANVVLLMFDGKPLWFQGINRPGQIMAIYDYIDRMLAADRLLPVPLELAECAFNYYAWSQCIDAPAAVPTVEVTADGLADGFLVLTHADTDVLTVQQSNLELPPGFPAVRAASLNDLRSEDYLMEAVLQHGKVPRVLVARLHGNLRSVPGLERLIRLVREAGGHLLFVNGVGQPDPELDAASTAPPALLCETMAYLLAGGRANLAMMFRFLADNLLLTGFGFEPPAEQPQHGIYHPDLPAGATLADWLAHRDLSRPAIGLLFYRAHWMSGNLDFIDAFVDTLMDLGADVLPVFTSSLKETLAQRASEGLASHALRASEMGERWPAAFDFLCADGQPVVDVVLSTLSFALSDGRDGAHALSLLDVPIMQAIAAGVSREQWAASPRGLGPLDTAINVALPELDGRIITSPTSFKEKGAAPGLSRREDLPPAGMNPAARYVPAADRVAAVSTLALRFAALRHKPTSEKRIAFVLTNNAGKAHRIGNAVGLDAPASLMEIFAAMTEAGYGIDNPFTSGDELIHTLIDRGCYDEMFLTPDQVADAAIRVPVSTYRRWFAELPETQREQMQAKWGPPPGEAYVHDGCLCLAGLVLGNVLVALQPPRGYGMDPQAIYHRPDLPPPHYYYALYRWLRDGWGADAVVHMGKHGSVEWLPGKAVGMSAECFPETMLGDVPLFYPFILSDPGEGMQAKRRGRAVIIDHLVPAMTTADAYGELDQLMQLVDEYYQLEMLDPSKLPLLQQKIWDLIRQANLDDDLKQVFKQDHGDHKHEWDEGITAEGTPLSLANLRGREFAHVVEDLDAYLCELAGAQIRDGLHTFGRPPEGEPLVDLLQSLTRLSNLEAPSLRSALAAAHGFDLDELLKDRGKRLDLSAPDGAKVNSQGRKPLDSQSYAIQPRRGESDGASDGTFAPTGLVPVHPDAPRGLRPWLLTAAPPGLPSDVFANRPLFSHADVLQAIDELSKHVLDSLRHTGFDAAAIDALLQQELPDHPAVDEVKEILTFVCNKLAPIIDESRDEVTNLLRGLDGRYVPAGPSGAPTRGMAHVLPTGRNFYALDPRAVPSEAAWRIGSELAREAAERHRRDTGAWPETVGLSIWGTSAMRTQGDDVAEVFAFLGVRPVWHRENRRLTGFDVIPLQELGRPRIDVLIRVSGFFRDAFPHVIEVLDDAVTTVARLDEPPELNFLRKHFLRDLAGQPPSGEPPGLSRREEVAPAGINPAARRDDDDCPTLAERRALYRVFSSPPGCYGAGILPLIDEQNWSADADFATAYVNWGGYAYTGAEQGIDARDQFRQRLAGVQVALHNQDNREHDIFDSDDYLQFHGGMIATIRALTGRQPQHYFGDTHDPARPVVRDLKEEALRVFRSRVVNPKWIEGVMRHGYKGGLELAATVDYLFGFDAAAHVVADWMYERVASAYALDPATQRFLAESNPWALRAMTERLLEAAKRGLWEKPNPETLAGLEAVYAHGDALLEVRTEVS